MARESSTGWREKAVEETREIRIHTVVIFCESVTATFSPFISQCAYNWLNDYAKHSGAVEYKDMFKQQDSKKMPEVYVHTRFTPTTSNGMFEFVPEADFSYTTKFSQTRTGDKARTEIAQKKQRTTMDLYTKLERYFDVRFVHDMCYCPGESGDISTGRFRDFCSLPFRSLCIAFGSTKIQDQYYRFFEHSSAQEFRFATPSDRFGCHSVFKQLLQESVYRSTSVNRLFIENGNTTGNRPSTLVEFASLLSELSLPGSSSLQHIISLNFRLFDGFDDDDDDHSPEIKAISYIDDKKEGTFNPWPTRADLPLQGSMDEITYIDPLDRCVLKLKENYSTSPLFDSIQSYLKNKDILSIQFRDSLKIRPMIVICSAKRLIRYKQQCRILFTYAFRRANESSELKNSIYPHLDAISDMMGESYMSPRHFGLPSLRSAGNIQVFSADAVRLLMKHGRCNRMMNDLARGSRFFGTAPTLLGKRSRET